VMPISIGSTNSGSSRISEIFKSIKKPHQKIGLV
jgi:hypothetical protein